MATGFNTRSGPDEYRLNFDTDNLDYYLLMQKIARHCVDGKPASDVAPVRHGRWKVVEALSDDIQTAGECNICGENISWFGKLPNYCPNCGARMDKEAEHEAD